MTVIGITGSIGSGKSTVANFFKELGAYIIDWDVLAREVVRPHRKAWNGIVEYFGTQVLNEDESINRPKLAEMVFGYPDKVENLNQITHPEIFKEDKKIEDEIRSREPSAVIIKDIPLLTKDRFRKFVEKVVVVYVSEENQMKRLRQRGLTEEEAKKRVKSQVPLSEKMKFADFIIYNDGSLEETKKQVEKIHNILKGEKSGSSRG
jgi:dephospho-CoA kinase